MANFDTNSVSIKDLQTTLTTMQSDYRATNSALQNAKRRGEKATVRELTRAKNRISAKLDAVKNQLETARNSSY